MTFGMNLLLRTNSCLQIEPTSRRYRSVAAIILALAIALLMGRAEAQERYEREPGFDRPGGDIESFEQTSDIFQHPVLCEDACSANSRCDSYTFVRPGIEGPNAWCRLKSGVPPAVESPCCISGVQGATPKSAKARPAMSLVWLGRDADKVGPAGAEPDGRTDVHFRLHLTGTGTLEIASIQLTRSVEIGGSALEPWSWSSRDPNPFFHGVETDGRMLGRKPTNSLGRLAEPAVLDLYGEDNGVLTTRSWVMVEVTAADGTTRGHWFRLDPPPGRLMGQWQALCPNNSPEAFEPMTLGGRLVLDVDSSGRLIGWLGAFALTGTVAPDGSVDAVLDGERGPSPWSGRIETSKDGSLSGSGNFTVVLGDDTCSAQWWNE
jgi:hypothetical protein